MYPVLFVRITQPHISEYFFWKKQSSKDKRGRNSVCPKLSFATYDFENMNHLRLRGKLCILIKISAVYRSELLRWDSTFLMRKLCASPLFGCWGSTLRGEDVRRQWSCDDGEFMFIIFSQFSVSGTTIYQFCPSVWQSVWKSVSTTLFFIRTHFLRANNSPKWPKI